MSVKVGLRTRLLLVMLPVAAFAILLTAFVSQRITNDQLQDQFEADTAATTSITRTLNELALTAQSWDEAVADIVDLARRFDTRIALTDIDGQVLVDTAVILDGEARPLPTQAGYIDPYVAAFEIDISPEREAERLAEEEFQQCLAASGVDDSFLTGEIPDGTSESELDAYFALADSCWNEAYGELYPSTDIGPGFDTQVPSVQPVLLFLGEAGPATDVLQATFDYRMALAILLIVLVAALAAYLFARRVLAPVSNLTRAARQVAAGGRPEPVDVAGDSELSELAMAFNSMGDTLRSEDESRRQLTTDIAHELRSPLQNIRGTLEAAQDGVRELDLPLVDSVHEEALHLQHLVDDLQVLALADAAKLHMHHQPVDIDEIVETAVRSVSQRADEAGVQIHQRGAAQAVVRGDSIRLRQVFTNLLDNAIRHTPSGGQIEVTCRREPQRDDLVVVEVRDTGEGIPVAFLPQVFERFSRADSARTRGTGGSGVGLAICQSLVEAHQGKISVTSEVGVGSVFRVELPVQPAGTTADT